MSSGVRKAAKVPTRSLILNEVERLIARKGVYGFTLRDVAGPLGVQVPAISVSESGYLQLPHKNKFGKEYPPVDSGGYVGTKP